MNSCEDGSGFQQPEAILQTKRALQHLLRFKQPFNLEVFAKEGRCVVLVNFLLFAEGLLQLRNHIVNLCLLIFELETVS